MDVPNEFLPYPLTENSSNVLEHVFSHLSPQELSQVRLVNKKWCEISQLCHEKFPINDVRVEIPSSSSLLNDSGSETNPTYRKHPSSFSWIKDFPLWDALESAQKVNWVSKKYHFSINEFYQGIGGRRDNLLYYFNQEILNMHDQAGGSPHSAIINELMQKLDSAGIQNHSPFQIAEAYLDIAKEWRRINISVCCKAIDKAITWLSYAGKKGYPSFEVGEAYKETGDICVRINGSSHTDAINKNRLKVFMVERNQGHTPFQTVQACLYWAKKQEKENPPLYQKAINEAIQCLDQPANENILSFFVVLVQTSFFLAQAHLDIAKEWEEKNTSVYQRVIKRAITWLGHQVNEKVNACFGAQSSFSFAQAYLDTAQEWEEKNISVCHQAINTAILWLERAGNQGHYPSQIGDAYFKIASIYSRTSSSTKPLLSSTKPLLNWLNKRDDPGHRFVLIGKAYYEVETICNRLGCSTHPHASWLNTEESQRGNLFEVAKAAPNPATLCDNVGDYAHLSSQKSEPEDWKGTNSSFFDKILPLEIMIQIFSALMPSDLFQVSQVNRQWHSISQDYTLIQRGWKVWFEEKMITQIHSWEMVYYSLKFAIKNRNIAGGVQESLRWQEKNIYYPPIRNHMIPV
ncbi:F-box-like domain-containing protein [Candidatus Paracaedibacter symbiosus]|uniref:F-box-like domain-containing protein n=1 Tax=Candidatus Paracaedibacter symbiosus TaxID=244582 RepID=UPI0018DE6FEA|nr:F-box-like domain-containing protein [Candidatus Paracaedibacter symbiosus]